MPRKSQKPRSASHHLAHSGYLHHSHYACTYKSSVRLTTEWLVVGYRTLKDLCECMSRSSFIGAFATEEGCGPVR